MSDRYCGEIKCPYCKKQTEFWITTDKGADYDFCDKCGTKFRILLELKTRKIKEGKQ